MQPVWLILIPVQREICFPLSKTDYTADLTLAAAVPATPGEPGGECFLISEEKLKMEERELTAT